MRIYNFSHVNDVRLKVLESVQTCWMARKSVHRLVKNALKHVRNFFITYLLTELSHFQELPSILWNPYLLVFYGMRVL
jgi:hypothetical protein